MMNSTACMHRRMAKFHPGIVKGMTACWSHIGLIIVEEKQHCSDTTPLHGNKEVAIMLCLHNYYNAVSRVPVPVPENFKLGCRLPVPEGKMVGCRSTFEPCLGVRQLE